MLKVKIFCQQPARVSKVVGSRALVCEFHSPESKKTQQFVTANTWRGASLKIGDVVVVKYSGFKEGGLRDASVRLCNFKWDNVVAGQHPKAFVWGTNDLLPNFTPGKYEKYYERYWNTDIAFKDKSNFSYDTIIGDEEYFE